MSSLPVQIVEMFSETIAKVIPITIGLALVFSVLSHFWACNPGTPWWRKRELITDICYWFFVPLFARMQGRWARRHRCAEHRALGRQPELRRGRHGRRRRPGRA